MTSHDDEPAHEGRWPVSVVVLRRDPGGSGGAIPVSGSVSVDLNSTSPPDRGTRADLLDSTVRLVYPDVCSHVIEAVRKLPVPPLFRTTPWLRHHRAVVVELDGRGRVGRIPCTYDPVWGLDFAGACDEEEDTDQEEQE